MSCGADTTANALIASLTLGEDFTIPVIDLSKPEYNLPYDPNSPLYGPVSKITVADLTTREVNGSGVYDALMESFRNHLRDEHEKGRITGAEYTKAYTAQSESAMNQAVSFLLGKDAAYWQAQAAQINALTARINLETAKMQLMSIQYEARNQKANFALTKLKLASEDIGYCTAKYNLETMLPAQYQTVLLEQEGQNTVNATTLYNLTTTLPLQTQLLSKQTEGQVLVNSTAQFQLSEMLPQQVSNLKLQENLLIEQTEAQHGQTSDTRLDGVPIRGVMGKQKDLYAQQIVSYKRDAEVKAGKLFTDAWITMKSIDEGLLPPNGFSNTSLDTVLTAIKTNNELN